MIKKTAIPYLIIVGLSVVLLMFLTVSPASSSEKTVKIAREAVKAFEKALRSGNAETIQKALKKVQANKQAIEIIKQSPNLSKQFDALTGPATTSTRSRLKGRDHDLTTQTDIAPDQQKAGEYARSEGQRFEDNVQGKLADKGIKEGPRPKKTAEAKKVSKGRRDLKGRDHDLTTRTDIVPDQQKGGEYARSEGQRFEDNVRGKLADKGVKEGARPKKTAGAKKVSRGKRTLKGRDHDLTTQTDIAPDQQMVEQQASKKPKDQGSGGALPKTTAQNEYELKGKSSFGSTKGVREVTGEIMSGVMVGGALGESMVQKMGEAADEDRDFTALDAVETLDEGLGIKSAREDVYRIANKHGKEEALKWQKGEQDLQQSLVNAGAKTIAEGAVELGEQMVVKPMEEVVENNLDEMEAKAKAEGRKPDMVDGAKFFFGSLGEGATNIVVGPAARAYGEATALDERRYLGRQKTELRKFVDRNLKHGLWKINRLQAELDNLIHQGDPNDSTNKKRTQELLNEYESEYLRMEKLRGLAERNLGDADAKRVNRMREELSYLTAPDTMREYADDMSKQNRDTLTGNHSSSQDGQLVETAEKEEGKLRFRNKDADNTQSAPITTAAIDAGGIDESVRSGEKAVEVTSKDGEASEAFVQEGEEHQVVSTKDYDGWRTVGQEGGPETESFGQFATGTSDDTLHCPEDPDELKAKCANVNKFIGDFGKGQWTASLQRAYLFRAQCCGYRWTTEGPEDDTGNNAATDKADLQFRETGKAEDVGLLDVPVDEKDKDMEPSASSADDQNWLDEYQDELQEHRAKKYKPGEIDKELQEMRRRQQQVANDPEWDMLRQRNLKDLGNAAQGLSDSLTPGSSRPSSPPTHGLEQQQRLPYMEKDPYINRGYRKYQEEAEKRKKQPSSKGTGSTDRIMEVDPGDTTVPGEDDINDYWPSKKK